MKESEIIFHKKLQAVEKTLPDYALLYFEAQRNILSIRTLLGYAYDVRTFLNFMLNRVWKYRMNSVLDSSIYDLNSISKDIILEFLEFLSTEQGYSNSNATYKRKFAAIDSFFKFYYKSKLIEENPCSEIEYPKCIYNERAEISNRDMQIFLQALKDGSNLPNCRQAAFLKGSKRRDLALVSLLLENIKLSKILSLNIKDVDFKKETIVFAHKNKDITLKISSETVEAIRAYIQEEREDVSSSALFISRQGKRICAQSVEDMLKSYSKLCKFDIIITPQLLNYYSRQKISKKLNNRGKTDDKIIIFKKRGENDD